MRYAKFQFSDVERVDLLKAWIATSITFAVYFTASSLSKADFGAFLFAIIFSALTAGIGFLGHELCHKWAASRFGIHSEFRSHDRWLVISIIIAFFGVIFAAPGAVYMFTNVSKRENGIISAAGPAANMVFALLFLPLAVFSPAESLLWMLGTYGLWINALLGLFNLIPFLDFDGAKIWAWHRGVWSGLVIIGAALIITATVI